MAELISSVVDKLFDLGCVTGMKLEEIFKIYPNVSVTGIDITREMPDNIKEKYYVDKRRLFKNGFGAFRI